MPGRISEQEEALRGRMAAAYKGQVHEPGGFDDYGEFTVQVVGRYQREVERLRALLERHGVQPGAWDDPVP